MKLAPAWYLPNGRINAIDSELEEVSSSCERWGIWCAALVIVSVLAEFAIAVSHPLYDSMLEIWGSAFADAFVAFGIVGEVGFGIWDGKIQTELRRRSNDKLEKAESELAKIKAPRSLTGEQIELLATKLRSLAGQMYDLTLPHMLEPGAGIHTQLMAALKMADWQLQSMKVAPLGTLMELNPITASFAFDIPPETPISQYPKIGVAVSDMFVGIHLGFEAGDSIIAHTALIEALRAVDTEAHLLALGQVILGKVIPPKASPTIVHIIIGRKN
jgi:hypothetical protein